jgi:hypothetical protein
MDSLSFSVGSFIPYNMPVYPGALRVADHARSGDWRYYLILVLLLMGFRD